MSITYYDRKIPGPSRTPEENEALCREYPFLARDGSVDFWTYEDGKPIDYTYTWEDQLEPGWQVALAPQMWADLKAILVKHNCLDTFRFLSIKEKWGELCMFYRGAPAEANDDLEAWERIYAELSKSVCVNCGEPATRAVALPNWINYLCDECAAAWPFKSQPLEKKSANENIHQEENDNG